MNGNIAPHERALRTPEVMDKMGRFRLAIVGCGAVGSHLAETLARMGYRNFVLIDHDRVDVDNLGSQAYSVSDQGNTKVDALAYRLHMLIPHTELKHMTVRIHHRFLNSNEMARRMLYRENLMDDIGVVVDCVDNRAGRMLLHDFCDAVGFNCLHVGFNENYGEVIWNESYIVPADIPEALDDCAHPYSITFILRLVGLAAEALTGFTASGQKDNYIIRGIKVSHE